MIRQKKKSDRDEEEGHRHEGWTKQRMRESVELVGSEMQGGRTICIVIVWWRCGMGERGMRRGCICVAYQSGWRKGAVGINDNVKIARREMSNVLRCVRRHSAKPITLMPLWHFYDTLLPL